MQNYQKELRNLKKNKGSKKMNKLVKYFSSTGYGVLRIFALIIFMVLSIFTVCKCHAYSFDVHHHDNEREEIIENIGRYGTNDPYEIQFEKDLEDSMRSEEHEDRCGSDYSPND